MLSRCLVTAGRCTPNNSANAFCVSQTVSSFTKTSTYTTPSGVASTRNWLDSFIRQSVEVAFLRVS